MSSLFAEKGRQIPFKPTRRISSGLLTYSDLGYVFRICGSHLCPWLFCVLSLKNLKELANRIGGHHPNQIDLIFLRAHLLSPET